MDKQARIVDGEAVDVCSANEVSSRYHGDLASQFQPVPDEVIDGWRLSEAGWSPPDLADSAPPPILGRDVRLLPVGLFLTRFPFMKLAHLKAQEADDPGVAAALVIINSLVDIDLNDPNTAGILGYFMQRDYLTEADVASILA